jgi:hypothetical protein
MNSCNFADHIIYHLTNEINFFTSLQNIYLRFEKKFWNIENIFNN